jgi:hypothetical protein
MSTIWRPVQFRIFNSQLSILLNHLEADLLNHPDVIGRNADPATEMYWGKTEFAVMDATTADQQLFDRARKLRYSIYPGRRLGGGGQIPDKYWDAAFWQAETTMLQSQIAMMEEDFRLMLDIENYVGTGLAWNHFTAGNSQWGTLDALRKVMAPYLRLITVNNLIPLLHPANLNSVLFTEIADAARGEICAQYERTFGNEFTIYTDAASWSTSRHTTETQFIAPLLRRYPGARISHGYSDTIIRKYWFNRLAQLSSVEDGHVFIDDQYKLDWSQLGEQSFFDCTHPGYNMNEGVVEAYNFRGDTQHLSDNVMRGLKRANIAVGMEDRKQLASRNNIGYNHLGAMTLESGGSTYLIDSGHSAVGVGYERALRNPSSGSGFSGAAFNSQPFTILLDFYLHNLSELHDPFGQRNPLLSVWGPAPQRWFRVYWRAPNEYVFQVVQEQNGSGSVEVVVDAGPQDSRRRRLQIASSTSQIQIWNDKGATQSAPYTFPVWKAGSLTLNYERFPLEGQFYYTKGAAYDQLVVWNRVLTKVPSGPTYPFMESQA